MVFDKTNFANLSATTEATKYGTYTITIEKDLGLVPLEQDTTTKVVFLPAFTDNADLKAVMGKAVFCDKDGNSIETLNNATSMTALATAIQDAGGISEIYIDGITEKPFYGLYLATWDDAFGSSSGRMTDFSDTFKETLLGLSLPTTNVYYENTGNFRRTSSSELPSMNGVTFGSFHGAYSTFFSDPQSYAVVWSSYSSDESDALSSTNGSAAGDFAWGYTLRENTRAVVLTCTFE